MIKSPKFWVGFSVSLLFLLLFFFPLPGTPLKKPLDFHEVGRFLSTANYLYVIPAIGSYFVAVGFRTLRWQFLLKPLRPVPARRLFPVIIVGYMANNLLPLRLGELVRVYYLGKKEPVSKSSALATVVVERVFDGLTLLFFVFMLAFTLPVVGLVQGLGESAGIPWILLATVTVVPFFVATGLLMLLSQAPGPALKLMNLLIARLPAGPRLKVSRVVELFIDGLRVLRSPRRILWVFAISLFVWLFEAFKYFLIGISFDLQSSFIGWGEMAGAILLITATSNLATSLPSSQGGVGPFEFFAAATLVLLGVGRSLASAYVVALHVALLVPVTILGLVILWSENLSLPQLARQRTVSSNHEFQTTSIPVKREDSP
ncbi:MAG: flippase-like domain-containing protein [Chloroflexi bacterium]|nr:flippase-like domain-containing protein [Chloroflexota bacterium]